MTENSSPQGPFVIDDITLSYEEVGPARAEEFLATYRTDYRKLKERHAQVLADDMLSDDWLFDGSPLRFCTDEFGNEMLFDGQHRCHALILSNTTQKFLIVRGLSAEAYDTTDTGKARTYADTLRRRDLQHVPTRVALLKLILRWQKGLSMNDSRVFSNRHLDHTYEQYEKEIDRAVSMTASMQHKVNIPPAITAFLWWHFSRVDKEKAYEFLIQLAEGEGLKKGMPVYTLRERLRRQLEPLTRNDYIHMAFNAFRATLEGRTLSRINLPSVQVTLGDIKRVEPKRIEEK